jgi:DNA-directed RNA polymerase subunit P
MVYRCAGCGRPYTGKMTAYDLSCECGSTIFFKERPNIEKEVKAR